MAKNQEIIIQNIDHLGIVAGIIDEIQIVKIINEKLGTDSREKITSGQIVKALIINALGMVSRPLYMFPQFFEDKAVEKLLGTGIKSEYLNDDKIGRVMDEIYKLGLTQLFIEIVLGVIKTFNIEVKYAHLDSTSFHLHGEYESEETPEEEEPIMKERPILIKKGYSRDHRPDLKQCVLDLIVNNQEGIPLFMRTGDGNESDKAVFAKILKEFKKQIQLDSIYIADSALYSQENIQLMKELEWITRVPATIKKVKELIQTVEIAEIQIKETMSQLEKERVKKLQEKGYKWQIEQRWLIVESEARKSSDSEKLENKIEQEFEKVEKLLAKLEREIFENSNQISYQLKGINKKLKFLMSVSLLVYNLGQRELRKALKRSKMGIKNQLGKLIDRPTLRWIFQCFQGIHLLILNGMEQVVNLTDERSFILEFLPASCQQYYL